MDEVEELAKVALGPFLAAEGLDGALLNAQAAKVYDGAVKALAKALTVSPEKLLDVSDAIKVVLLERGVSLKSMTADKCARAAAIALGLKCPDM